MLDVLKSICAHFGVAVAFQDVWGRQQDVGAETLRAVLAEFDVAVSSVEAAQAELTAIHQAAAHTGLPPALAIEAGLAAWTVDLASARTVDRLRWHIALEDGRMLQGDATAGQRLTLPVPLPPGYHRLTVDGIAGGTLVISAPARCYRPAVSAEGGRLWGPSVQLYALRSARNWGMGDFTDLNELIGLMAGKGAAFVGLNPLHALFADRPAHASPYSPSSRRLLNVLYIDPTTVEGFADCAAAEALVGSPSFQARLAALRAAPFVDYDGVAAAKFEVLGLLFADVVQRRTSTASQAAGDPAIGQFDAFIAAGGITLREHAVFEALQVMGDAPHGNPPADRILYHQYLQWLAHLQLQRASDLCSVLGMPIGLYLDLAVSVDGSGSDVWGAPDLFAARARVGAPPDAFNPNGQDWGLRPMRADRLRADGYRYFIDTLRASMQRAGAVRIDHVMGLMRLYWIPAGQTARTGTYVHYEVDEVLAIVALESQRNRCMVIGEDLGTVAPQMQEAMAARDLLSYRLMYFERDAEGFVPPSKYPSNGLVAVSTHDLATFAGWWSGEDLRVRLAQSLYPAPEIFEGQLRDRSRERAELLTVLRSAGLITHAVMASCAFCELPPPALTAAVHSFLASTPCALMVVQLEDVLGVQAQANMPGTTTEEPNWRRKLPLDLTALAASEALSATAQLLNARRPLVTAVQPHPPSST